MPSDAGDTAARGDDVRSEGDIVARAADGIFTISTDGTVMTWNAAMERTTGYAADKVIGGTGLRILRARDAQGREVVLDRWAETDAALPTEVKVLTSTGEQRWLSFSYSSASAAADEPLIVIARDVTTARELDLLRDDFVATVSHELRAPLSPIKGWASTLLNFGDNLKAEDRQAALQSILQQTTRLERLIASLLEVSRIEHGMFEAVDTDVDMDAVVRRVIDDVQAVFPDRAFRVVGGGVRARVKELWVEQIVTNLVDNAVKYSPETEPIEVTLVRHHNSVEIAVVDRGRGISDDELGRVFERFHRVQNSGPQTGAGLGLYIARQLAEQMNGTIAVASVPGHGSTFTLRLPVRPRVVELHPQPEVVGIEAG